MSLLEELQPQEIIIGDSPVQECVFENIVFIDYINAIRNLTNAKVRIVDLSMLSLSTNSEKEYGKVENRDASSFLLFDVRCVINLLLGMFT